MWENDRWLDEALTDPGQEAARERRRLYTATRDKQTAYNPVHLREVHAWQQLVPASGRVDWSPRLALARLGVTQSYTPFLDGRSSQGESEGHKVWLNPYAFNPLKTCLHELAHIQLGHSYISGDDSVEAYRASGGHEFAAEATAYLVMKHLGALTAQSARVSRAYIAGWLKGGVPNTAARQAVLSASSVILSAGM